MTGGSGTDVERVDRGWRGFRPGTDPLPLARTVRAHVPWGLVLLGVPLLGGLTVGVVIGIVDAVRAGNVGEPFGVDGWSPLVVVGWLVVLALLPLCAGALAVLVSFRSTLTTSRSTTWFLWRRSTVSVEDATAVELQHGRDFSVTGRRPAALVVRGADGEVAASYRSTEADWVAVLAVLREWVRRRPELVRDEATRELFAVLDATGRTA
ncbi:hypothetical protein KMZ32_00925 [Phycicoccus sp. MAQZ13P-2]|uniref:hypothetical protein n=1 Tax=Phycicoccus mangrovi TaxID=2840470 RepID=UPI001C0033E6|nr:hypothetical protein [Phycicoccus mangrovi]MBT9254254.1 hypothetical protein [Phycicoccus mangrovi]MBT9272632.1 hypothetical protein [Phycicoccus mangrovi]